MTDGTWCSLSKATPLRSETIPDLHIVANVPIDSKAMSLDALQDRFAFEATRLAEAMFTCLPGGLVDAILVELMRRKVSVLAVPCEAQKCKGADP